MGESVSSSDHRDGGLGDTTLSEDPLDLLVRRSSDETSFATKSQESEHEHSQAEDGFSTKHHRRTGSIDEETDSNRYSSTKPSGVSVHGKHTSSSKSSTSIDPSSFLTSCSSRRDGEMKINAYSKILDVGKKPPPNFPNCGVINFSNASFASNFIGPVPVRTEKSSSKNVPSEQTTTKNVSGSSISTLKSKPKGFFASLKENCPKSGHSNDNRYEQPVERNEPTTVKTDRPGKVLSSRNQSSSTTMTSTKRQKPITVSRQGYFASLKSAKQNPEVEDFFALTQTQRPSTVEKEQQEHNDHPQQDYDHPQQGSYRDDDLSSVNSENVEKVTPEDTGGCFADESDLMTCEKCSKKILVWDLPEHMDFHYAKSVQDSMKKDFLNLYNTSWTLHDGMPPPRKKNRTGSSSGPKVESYFSPVPRKKL